MKTLLIAAFAALMMIATPAMAADVNIAVVDLQALLKGSKAAQNIESQVVSMRKTFTGEVEAEEKSLRAKEKAIIDQKSKLSETELKAKADEFQKQVAAGQKKIQDRKTSLDKSINAAYSKLKAEVVKIVAAIGEKKNLDLVLARTDVVIVNKDLDITADVLKALDTQLSSVKVE